MKLPYGISNFETLVDESYFFIDKTPYIAQLENQGERYLFFLRPRRFGKSLFISLLHYYYDVNARDKFTKLFGRYYIAQHPTPGANNYRILRFEFSRINTTTTESTFDGFRNNVLIGVRNFCSDYGLDFDGIEVFKEPAQILQAIFARSEQQKSGYKIYILIDEYDHFANEILAQNPTDFINIVGRTGFVRKFYESIKTATGEGLVDRLFVTGVTPITLDSLTSGFNIARNLSVTRIFNEMMGFTEADVLALLQETCPAAEKPPADELLKDLRRYYNGYLFNHQAEQRLYNPDMVLYFLTESCRDGRFSYPDQLLDANIASDYGKVSRLIRVSDYQSNLETLNELIVNKEVAANLTAQFSLEKELDRDDFISLLFYMGIVTIRGQQLARLKFVIPNYVIETLYLKFLTDLVEQQYQIKLTTEPLEQALADMALRNKLDGFTALVEDLLGKLSYQDFKKFDEKYIKVVICAYLSLSNLYFIKSEYEVPGGYVDLLLLTKPPVIPDYQFALELKYLKKGEAKKLAAVKTQAISQLRGYLATPEAQAMPNLRGYALVFVGNKCKVCEAIVRS